MGIKGKSTALGALCAASIMASAAWADPIRYSGTQQVGSIFASYSLTTDGSLGDITGDNVLSFDVTLSDAFGSLSFSNDTFGASVFGDFGASASEIYLPRAVRGRLHFELRPGSGQGLSNITFEDIQGASAHAQIQDSNGSRVQNIFFSNPVATADVAPAVPEPATWAMMILGMGVVGGALRSRRRQQVKVRFQAA